MRHPRISAMLAIPLAAALGLPLVANAVSTSAEAEGGTSQLGDSAEPDGVTNLDGAPMVEEDLGRPITTTGIADAGYTTDDSGRAIAVNTVSGNPAVFSAIDVETGELLMQQEIGRNGTTAKAFATGLDGNIYFGMTKGIGFFRFDPNQMELTQIAEQPFGQTHSFVGTTAPDGSLLFGTYPGGKVISYDPSTDEWHDYGSVVSGAQYVQSLDADENYIYAGTGTNAKVVRIDVDTGAIEEIPLPDGYTDENFVFDVGVRGDLLFARPRPKDDLLVYSLTEEAWVETIPDVAGRRVSPAVTTHDSGQARTEVLISLKARENLAYDIDTRESRVISLEKQGQVGDWWLHEFPLDGFPGESLVTVGTGDNFYVWNPETGATTTIAADVAPAARQLRSIAVGPEGDIWSGGYHGGLSRVDADSGDITQLKSRGQPEAMVAHDQENSQIEIPSAGYTTDSSGRVLAVSVASGEPGMFSAVDIESGEQLMQQKLVAGNRVFGYDTGPDGTVYFGTARTGEVYEFDPDSLELELIDTLPGGQTHLWDTVVGSDGTVYFGTYPDAKVVAYSPGTGEWRDYGNVLPSASYVRYLDVSDDYIYAGTGSDGARLVRIDIQSGEIDEISLPNEYGGRVYDVSVRGDYVFARPSNSTDLHVWSISEQAWVDVIHDASGVSVSPVLQTEDSGSSRSEVLVSLRGQGVIAYDLDTRAQRTVSLELANARNWGLVELDLDDFPGVTAVTSSRTDGTFHLWNPQTGATETRQPDLAAPFGSYLVYGTYTKAKLWAYNSGGDWRYGSNPGSPVWIGHEQDRPVAFASAGDVVAVGTWPEAGVLGGALSLFNPATGDLEVFRNVVQDQGVLALAYHDGLIYGSTGISGGLGTEPTTSEGHLFIFDPETSEVVYSGVPVPGAEHVTALTFDDDGYLWGLTYGDLFKFDPETREVVHVETYFERDDSGPYAAGRQLFWHENKLVGSVGDWVDGQRIFEIDPESLEMNLLIDDATNLAIDRNGSYYYTRGASLFRLVEVTCDDIVDGRHNGPLTVSEGTTCLNNATVEGPIEVDAGAGIYVTDSDISGPVTSDGASSVTIRHSEIDGPVTVRGTTGQFVISGTTVTGPLACTGNAEEPDDEDEPNTINGPASGQCADL